MFTCRNFYLAQFLLRACYVKLKHSIASRHVISYRSQESYGTVQTSYNVTVGYFCAITSLEWTLVDCSRYERFTGIWELPNASGNYERPGPLQDRTALLSLIFVRKELCGSKWQTLVKLPEKGPPLSGDLTSTYNNSWTGCRLVGSYKMRKCESAKVRK